MVSANGGLDCRYDNNPEADIGNFPFCNSYVAFRSRPGVDNLGHGCRPASVRYIGQCFGLLQKC